MGRAPLYHRLRRHDCCQRIRSRSHLSRFRAKGFHDRGRIRGRSGLRSGFHSLHVERFQNRPRVSDCQDPTPGGRHSPSAARLSRIAYRIARRSHRPQVDREPPQGPNRLDSVVRASRSRLGLHFGLRGRVGVDGASRIVSGSCFRITRIVGPSPALVQFCSTDICQYCYGARKAQIARCLCMPSCAFQITADTIPFSGSRSPHGHCRSDHRRHTRRILGRQAILSTPPSLAEGWAQALFQARRPAHP